MMKKMFLLLAAGVLLTSCVSKKAMVTLQNDYNKNDPVDVD